MCGVRIWVCVYGMGGGEGRGPAANVVYLGTRTGRHVSREFGPLMAVNCFWPGLHPLVFIHPALTRGNLPDQMMIVCDVPPTGL